jgi:outer membrane protein
LKYLVLALLFCINTLAQDEYSLRLALGKATESDFSEIFSGDIRETKVDYNVYAIDGGYLLEKNWLDAPLDAYLKAGLAYYEQSDYHNYGNLDDTYESVLYIKIYYNLDFLNNRIRIGLGEGISYTLDYLEPEYHEAVEDKDNHSKVLNYLDFSIDFDFGRVVQYEHLYGTYIGWSIKHRSGVFGLVNNVKEGGANYNTFYIEKNF